MIRKTSSILLALGVLASASQAQTLSTMSTDMAAPETLHALLSDNTLIKFNAAEPAVVKNRVSLQGFSQSDERIMGIDFRVAYGVMYAVSNLGQMYTIDTESGQMTPIGKPTQGVRLDGELYGVDFNPAADRIRVVTDGGVNGRMHPETGLYVDNQSEMSGVQFDGDLQYSADDVAYGLTPRLVAAAYTYNAKNNKLTTNFAIDAAQGTLVTQGTRETEVNQVSPNTGKLYTVGSLATGPVVDAHFDIADVTNAAYVALSTQDKASYTLYKINLDNAELTKIGELASGNAIVGMAIEP
ncbi:DUF4394 domain-containing protein [Marinomonas hwangdonensis]|uniref:DUF4394 domain-containing protein n=1 Tax=Marinomonas hwangdonensis TaxID=1053647 RepID=A0A3M8Q1L4_9GAMM|nr:DUF4394 domain-containing protein [Marinomonas hwangdonensis]RNF48840.1 DUF4394 domain-containing protein [Marinomonas hwangdonensis]